MKKSTGKKKPTRIPSEIASLSEARTRRRDFEEELRQRLANLDERLLKIEVTYRELVRASNAASALLAAVEKLLDEKFGAEWDYGIREEVAKKAELAGKIKTAYVRAARKDLDSEQLVTVADEIRSLARELGQMQNNVVMVMHLYTRARNYERIKSLIEEIEGDGLEVSQDLRDLIERFKAATGAE